MFNSSGCKVSHLVVDSGAFIRGSPLHEIGETIYTIPEVVDEIKDKATRERVATLPYEIQFKQPPAEDIKWIVQFAKKTGDFHNLSAVDVKLLALTYFLEKQFNGDEHLNKEPNQVKVVTRQPNHVVQSSKVNLTGFYTPRDDEVATNDENKEENKQEHSENNENQQSEVTTENKEESTAEDEESNEPENDEDDKSWITPKNITEIKERLSSLKIEEKDVKRVSVACITSDFAMQNMLLQIGLKVVSVDNGLVIRQTKQFVLRCHACFKITSNLGKKFCPHCGNLDTLKRVSYRINDKGEKVIQINPARPINVRGKRYSLPMPKGGKHANNPILVEDQPIPQNRASKFALTEKSIKEKVLDDPDYVVRNTPFAVNDVYSRASRFKIRGNNFGVERKRNPNEVRKPTGNRKKSSY